MTYRHQGFILTAASLAFLGAALACGPVAAQAQAAATVTFTPATVVIEQGTLSIDFFGTISNPTGSDTFAPTSENFDDLSGGQKLSSLITTYDLFGPADNLPASVDPGTTTPAIDFFTIDTSALAPDTYTESMSLTDANGNTAAPSGFVLTVVPAPEPSAVFSLALGATAVGILTLRGRRGKIA